MSRFWNFLCGVHSLAGPVLMFLYPLYASVVAIETPSKLDDEQWLVCWILYSFLTLSEMVLQSILEWIPIWYTVKLVLVAWLVLPQFRGAAFIYERFVREKIKQYRGVKVHHHKSSPNGKGKKKFVDFIKPKKGSARHPEPVEIEKSHWWLVLLCSCCFLCLQTHFRFVACGEHVIVFDSFVASTQIWLRHKKPYGLNLLARRWRKASEVVVDLDPHINYYKLQNPLVAHTRILCGLPNKLNLQ